ncbi:hypothetical protein [Oryza sativa Japonica Group]|uniref:Uncharacterized protein n=1 Tax=Oryza sativa subsp. japonica TaxID=39947 RepID=Q5ZDR3_ORYSJ|nr:hypothetical protein [Oryza sativa Japonica Group]
MPTSSPPHPYPCRIRLPPLAHSTQVCHICLVVAVFLLSVPLGISPVQRGVGASRRLMALQLLGGSLALWLLGAAASRWRGGSGSDPPELGTSTTASWIVSCPRFILD